MLLNIKSRTADIAYFLLIASNLFYSPTLTWGSDFLKFGYSKSYIVFGAFLVSSILACITEFLLAPSRRPKARSISSPFNVVSLAILRTLTVTGIILGLVYTSPFRVITLTLGSQLWIHKIQHPQSLLSKTVLLFLLGWLFSFFSDIKTLKELELSASTSTTFKNLLFSYTWLMISCIGQYSRKFFEIKLVASSVAPLGFKAKELNIHFQMIFSLATAALITIPWLWVDQSLHSGEPIKNPHTLLYQLMCFASFASTVILSDYYIELLAQTELHTFKHIPYVWATSVVGSFIHIWLSTEEENSLRLTGLPTTLTFFEFLALGSIILGFIAAYSTQNQTLSKKSKSLDLMTITSESSWSDTISYFIKSILASQDSKQIFYFLLLNLSYMFVQLAYGFWTNSLGLISDAIHMFFDCVALGVGLFASVTSKWKKNREFSYGYSRVEVLSGFSNGIFLALISIFIVLEAIARLLHPPEMNTDRLLLVSFMGLVVNLIGILAFNHGHHHGHSHGHDHGHSHSHEDEHTSIQMNGASHSHDHDHHDHSHSYSHDHGHDHGHEHGHDHSHSNGHSHSHDHEHSHGGGGCGGHSHNMEGVFLHILADTLGSVGVIISTLLIQWFGWTGFDPIASMFIAGLIFFSVLPLIRSSFNILLLYVPPHINQSLNYSLKEISSQLGQNCEILEAKIWPNDHDSYVLTLSLKFYENFKSNQVQSKVEKIINRNLPSVKDVTIQTFS